MKMDILKHFGLAALLALGANAGAETVAKIGTAEYETIGGAVADAAAGQTVEIVKAGEYGFPALTRNITITCCEGVVFNCVGSGSISSVPNGCTVNGGTFNMGQSGYHGWWQAGLMTFNGSTFNGLFLSYGDMVFNECHFVQTAKEYNMWTYGGDIAYVGCDFTFKGKCINVYRESATPYAVSFSGCTFNSDTKNKAAVNVKATCVNGAVLSYAVTVTDCQVNDSAMFPTPAPIAGGLLVIDSLIQVDDIDVEHQPDNTTVFLNGKPAYPVPAAASETKVEVTEPIVAKDEKGEVITGDDAEAAQQAAAAAVAQIVANKGAAMTEGTGVEAAVFAPGDEVKQDVVSGLQAAANDVVKDDKGTALSEAEKTEVQQKVAEIATSKDVSSYVKIDVKSPAVKVEDKVATVKTLVYDVQPMAVSKITTTADTANPKTVTVEAPVVYNDATKPIKFRLPLTDAFTVSAIVTHEGDPDRLCMVQGTAGALYVEVSATHFSLFSVAPSDIVETSASSKTVLGIKRIDYTVTQTTADLAAAVPWLKAADADMPVAQLISTGLGEGDQIQVYDLEKKTYYSWHYVGTSWTADALSTGGSSPSAETYTLKRGRAFWYKPAGGKGTAGTYTQVGLYSEASITSKVDSATVTSASFANPVHFLMASPKYENVNLKEKLTCDAGCGVDDVVVIVATGARYRFNGSVWGQDKVVEKVSRFDGETYTTSEFAEVTGDIVVPAGTAFWYLSAGGAPEFEW